MDTALAKLEEEVWEAVNRLRDSPQARLTARKEFYIKFGHGSRHGEFGYGDSEIAFLGWEERCVLRPSGATPPGSEWWSEVNLWFIYLSELGAKAFETGFPKSVLPATAQFWFSFLERPDSIAWYRAHNSSIIDGYLKYAHLAAKETLPEMLFINMVLYRLLYAQAMVEGKAIFPKLTRILGDPRGDAVRFITRLNAYYPANYPMTEKEIADVLGRSHSLDELGVELLDDVLIEPELTHLYREAAAWNNQPALLTLIVNHKPAYPTGIRLPGTHSGFFVMLLQWLRRLFFKDR